MRVWFKKFNFVQMKNFRVLKITALLLLICSIKAFSQETNTDSLEVLKKKNSKGFHVGLYVGSYFANQYTSNMYDGYGFDINGAKNDWDNSFMNQKINMQYGGYGYPGQPDQIATALGIDYQTWVFDESDMPTNMRYTPAFMVGLNCRYSVDEKNAILFNLDVSKLAISGNFTIMTPQQATSTQVNNRIKTFQILGGEQRMLLQFGYQHLFGEIGKLNFFAEGGMHLTITEFNKNQIQINNLTIDLTSYYNTTLYSSAVVFKKPIGAGLGVFGGMGLNIAMNPKITVQLLYNPTYEKVNIGISPKLTFQNAVGLRAYYNW